MRTTVEMKPKHRSALLALAARRGQKGFSAVLEEAIEHYLDDQAEKEKRVQKFLSLAGSFSPADADALRRTVAEIRESWR